MLQLRLWLYMRFNLDPEDGGDCMPHGRQNDTFNCGPVTSNTIAHFIFKEPVWNVKKAIHHHVQWFLRFVCAIPSPVKIPSMAMVLRDSPTLKEPVVTEEQAAMDIDLSIAIAVGDHNFPDLPSFIVEVEDVPPSHPLPHTRQHLSFLELLNPMPSPPDHTCQHLSLLELLNPMPDDFTSPLDDLDAAEYAAGDLDADIGVEDDSGTYAASDKSVMRMDVDYEETPPSPKAEYALKEGGPKRKRQPMYPALDGTDDELSEQEQEKKKKKEVGNKKKEAGMGTSKSAKATFVTRKSLREGTFKIKKNALNKWRQNILSDDPYAEFDPLKDIRAVRHSGCGSFFIVKEPFDLTRWRSHLKACNKKPRKKAVATQSLFAMGFTSKNTTATAMSMSGIGRSSKEPSMKPCPGISELDNAQVHAYLHRTAVPGGGGQRIDAIAKDLFKKTFGKLSKARKEEVMTAQVHGHRWKNDHQRLHVFSTSCQQSTPDRTPNRALPCESCQAVFKSREFKTAIQKPTPQAKNQIYTNNQFRNKLLGEIYGRTIGLKDIIEDPVCNFDVTIF